ncbi:chaplin family protein [Streptomyces sp. NBC_00433]
MSGNACANVSSGSSSSAAAPGRSGSARPARHAGSAADESVASGIARGRSGGAHAAGDTHGSAGVLAGNGLLLPLDLPLNLSGNGVSAVGVGNPSGGNTAVNGETPPPPVHAPIPAPPGSVPEQVSPAETAPDAPTLAHTGAGGVGTAAAGSLALLLGGAVLYRRARGAARR